jgi:hypothetical protein
MTMSSRRTSLQIIVSVVALFVLLCISIRFISASPAEAKEVPQSPEQARIEALSQQIEALNQLVVQLSNPDEHVLVLRIDQECLGGNVTVQSTILQISVDRNFFDSCNIGDDLSESSRIRLLSSSLLTDTRVYVEDKFIISR